MKDKKIQEKINVHLQNKKKLKEKGITLIALVVTIIILLILAGVTLNMAMNGDGLFSRARNAADKYKKAQEDEAKLISEIGKEMNSEYAGAFVTGYNPEEKTDENPCIIGTDTSGYTNEQKFTTEEMKWRIWDYDGTTLRLISEKSTTQTLQLTNVNGYNNGVWAMNEICRECYNSNETGVEVRNLRRSDIEAVSNYDYTKYKHNPSSGEEVIGNNEQVNLIYYGQTKTCDTKFQSPIMWEKHDKDWTYKYDSKLKKETGDKSIEIPWEQEYGSDTETKKGSTTKNTEFTQSFYVHNYKGKENEFKNSIYYDMIFNYKNGSSEGRYWLSGRYVLLFDSWYDFGLNTVKASTEGCVVGGMAMFSSNGTPHLVSGALRPIVSINLESSGYKLVLNDGTDGARYKITKGAE